jgi:hypothetical protein
VALKARADTNEVISPGESIVRQQQSRTEYDFEILSEDSGVQERRRERKKREKQMKSNLAQTRHISNACREYFTCPGRKVLGAKD